MRLIAKLFLTSKPQALNLDMKWKNFMQKWRKKKLSIYEFLNEKYGMHERPNNFVVFT